MHPAQLTLPYLLGPGQFDGELSVEFKDGSGPLQRLDPGLVTVGTTARVVRSPLLRLGEVHSGRAAPLPAGLRLR